MFLISRSRDNQSLMKSRNSLLFSANKISSPYKKNHSIFFYKYNNYLRSLWNNKKLYFYKNSNFIIWAILLKEGIENILYAHYLGKILHN